jgi:uncharacterized protein YecT (DUF1311 family)
MIAMLLAAALNCGKTATQLDLDFCAARDARIAAAREETVLRRTLLHFPSRAKQIDGSERAWKSYRDAACRYAGAGDGSIEPMLYRQCLASLADERARVLQLFDGSRGMAAPSAGSASEEEGVYGKLELLVDPGSRTLLARSEDAWRAYRRVACTGALPGCATMLARARTATLKASWLADPFW